MEKLLMALRIAGAMAIVAAFILLFTNYAQAATISMAVAVLCLAVVAGSRVSTYFHEQCTRNLRK